MKIKLYDWYMWHKEEKPTKDYLNQSFEFMLNKEKDLSSYISDFQIVEEEGVFLGTYSNETKVICINQRELEKLPSSSLYALQCIRHEMEHARNLQILENRHQDIETQVINYALKDYVLRHHLDWHPNLDNLDPFYLRYNIINNYETNPGERLAEIRSWKYIVNLLKNQRTSIDLLLARKALYYSYIRGYENNRYYLESPTYQFLLNTQMFHEYYWLDKRVKRKDYNFETRITYGLPITEKEYNEKVLQKVKLQKKKM